MAETSPPPLEDRIGAACRHLLRGWEILSAVGPGRLERAPAALRDPAWEAYRITMSYLADLGCDLPDEETADDEATAPDQAVREDARTGDPGIRGADGGSGCGACPVPGAASPDRGGQPGTAEARAGDDEAEAAAACLAESLRESARRLSAAMLDISDHRPLSAGSWIVREIGRLEGMAAGLEWGKRHG